MAKLAIKGCEFRGNEVIAILKMLGCKNTDKYNGESEWFYYYIDNDGNIECDVDEEIPFPCIYFTLEEFLAKYPYKVGDKVYYDNKVCDVIEMLWNSNLNTISYGVYDGKIKNLAIAEELKSYKEETMEGKKLNSNASFLDCSLVDKIELVLGDTHEVVVEDGKTFVVRKKPQYPKTYEKSCEAVNASPYVALVYDKFDGETYSYDIDNLQHYENIRELLICRDAYWKIAGEQMGLGKPWKPDWENGLNKCCLTVCENRIIKSSLASANAILAFPTEEIRNAFYENFKELIQQCKELL